MFSLFLYASDTHSSHFQTSRCVQETTWIRTLFSLWQQKRNLKQGHVNWPRYCNHAHKGQYPAWEETSTSCGPRQLLCSGGGFNFNAPAPLRTLASDESLGHISWHSPCILLLSSPSITATTTPFPSLPSPLPHVSFKMEELPWLYTMIDVT